MKRRKQKNENSGRPFFKKLQSFYRTKTFSLTLSMMDYRMSEVSN
jgi:hypothetical protein